MPVQTQEATTLARQYQYILFGTQNWSMLKSPSQDYLFAWCYTRSLHTITGNISHAFLLCYVNKNWSNTGGSSYLTVQWIVSLKHVWTKAGRF